jgi:hypothetical protein
VFHDPSFFFFPFACMMHHAIHTPGAVDSKYAMQPPQNTRPVSCLGRPETSAASGDLKEGCGLIAPPRSRPLPESTELQE